MKTHRITRPAAWTSLALAMATPSLHAEPIAAVVITASRTPQALADTISDTITINAEQIAESGAGSIIDLLQRQRGIEIARNGGSGTSASVFLRGANSNQNVVLVDGVRIGSSTTGAANWSAIPLSAIDHIEIVYGPLSSLYGADAIGGVIQIFTRKGKGAATLSGSAGYGTDNSRAAEAAIAGSVQGFSYALSAGKEKSDGFSATRPASSSYNPDKDGYDRQNAAARLGWEWAEGQEIGTQLMHGSLRSQYDNGASAFDVRSIAALNSAAVFSHNQILPNWLSAVQYAQTRDDGATYSSAAASGYSKINTRQSTLSWQNDITIGSDVLQLLYERRKEEVVTNGYVLTEPQRVTNAIASSYSARRGDQLFNASIRRDRSIYGSKNTGALGYGYYLNRDLRASASYGTSFRAPTYNELYYPSYGNPANKPELGKNAEIGLHYTHGATSVNANYYRNRITDLLVNTTPCPYGTAAYKFGCAYNVNHALLAGLTLSASQQLGAFTFAASGDWQNPKDETSGKRLARRSRQHGNLTADYSGAGWKAGVEVVLSGDRFDDAANKSRLAGYGLVNLYATYQLNRDWSTLVRWNNVGDKQYDLARNYSTPMGKVFAGIRYGYQ
jgi:vitamin B12 transporter